MSHHAFLVIKGDKPILTSTYYKTAKYGIFVTWLEYFFQGPEYKQEPLKSCVFCTASLSIWVLKTYREVISKKLQKQSFQEFRKTRKIPQKQGTRDDPYYVGIPTLNYLNSSNQSAKQRAVPQHSICKQRYCHKKDCHKDCDPSQLLLAVCSLEAQLFRYFS